jgi:hypothetical protein
MSSRQERLKKLRQKATLVTRGGCVNAGSVFRIRASELALALTFHAMPTGQAGLCPFRRLLEGFSALSERLGPIRSFL